MNTGAKQAVIETTEKTEEAAEEAVRNPFIKSFSRFGFYAKGALFLVIGVFGIFLTAGIRGGKITDPIGAMSAVAQVPFGKPLLIVFILGALGHGMWNILRGAADVDNAGTGFKGIIARIASVGIGIFYFVLAVTAAYVVFSSPVPKTSGEVEETLTAILLAIPYGAIFVFFIGLGFFAAAGHESYSGITGKFRDNYKNWEINPSLNRLVFILGSVSFSVRALIYLLIGYFFLRAAWMSDPKQAEGLDGALLALAQNQFGGILLTLASIGLICHGVLAFFEAKYRRVS